MGLFSRLFKKKRGGTFFGNLFRGVSSTATGGILGTGAGLAKFEAEQAQKEYDVAKRLEAQSSTGFQIGSAIGKPLNEPFNAVVQNSEAAKKLQNEQVKSWLKRNWIKIVGSIVTIVVLIFVFKKMKRVKAY